MGNFYGTAGARWYKDGFFPRYDNYSVVMNSAAYAATDDDNYNEMIIRMIIKRG